MNTEERLTALERKMAEQEVLIARLIAFARLYPVGRVVLKGLGL